MRKASLVITALLAGLALASSTAASTPQPVTRMYVPRLHLLVPRVQTTGIADLGPTYWPGTGRPGWHRTIAIAGHRITHTHPFYFLDTMRPGDTIILTYMGKRHVYVVTGKRIFPSDDTTIAEDRGYEILMLTACTPRGSAAYRLVVYAFPKH